MSLPANPWKSMGFFRYTPTAGGRLGTRGGLVAAGTFDAYRKGTGRCEGVYVFVYCRLGVAKHVLGLWVYCFPASDLTARCCGEAAGGPYILHARSPGPRWLIFANRLASLDMRPYVYRQVFAHGSLASHWLL